MPKPCTPCASTDLPLAALDPLQKVVLAGRACANCLTTDAELRPAGHLYTTSPAGRLGWAVGVCPLCPLTRQERRPMTPESLTAGAWWLAASHPTPRQVWEDWNRRQRVALLPAGYRWDALALPHQRLADATPEDGAPWSSAPVMVDRQVERAYILVPPGTAATWDVPDTKCLGRGFWLAASCPSDPEQPYVARWHTPPTAHPTLAAPAALRAALLATGTAS
ncbi:hypothetical protein ACFV3P_24895 [Streptomyces albidoflavus]